MTSTFNGVGWMPVCCWSRPSAVDGIPRNCRGCKHSVGSDQGEVVGRAAVGTKNEVSLPGRMPSPFQRDCYMDKRLQTKESLVLRVRAFEEFIFGPYTLVRTWAPVQDRRHWCGIKSDGTPQPS